MNSLQQMRRPLVGIALSVAAGCFLGRQLVVPLLWMSLSAFALAGACRAAARSRGSLFVYLSCLMLAGAGASVSFRFPSPVLCGVGDSDVPVELVGTVAEDPVLMGGGGEASFAFRIEAVRRDDKWWPVHGTVRVSMDRPDSSDVTYGSRWRLSGLYSASSAVRRGISGSFRMQNSHALQIGRPEPSLVGWSFHLRRRAAEVLGRGLADFPEHAGLLRALLLGYRRAMPPDLYQTFAHTGTLHIFAISGLHVGVMASILIAVLKTAGVRRARWGFFLVPALLLYVVGTGMKPSALRAFTMAAIYFSAPLAGRRPDPASSIALAAVLLLALNPTQIEEPGFLLSFTVVSGIVMVHGDVARRLRGFRRPAWTLPLSRLGGPHPLHAFLRAVGLLLVTSLAAWLFSVPLTGRFFNTLSPVALAGNPVIIPVTFLIVLSGCLSLLSGGIPALAVIFNHAARWFVGGLISVIRFLGELPGAYFFVTAPPAVALILWYAGLCLLFSVRRLKRPAVLLISLSVAVWLLAGIEPAGTGVQVARKGRSAFSVRLPGGRRIAACEGSAYGISRLSRLLQRQGIDGLDSLAVRGVRPETEQSLREFCSLFAVGDLRLIDKKTDRPEWAVGSGSVSIRP